MKMYLRRQQDKLFYSGHNGVPAWTKNSQNARFFLSFSVVDALCAEHNLQNMEIVVEETNGEFIIKAKPPPKKKCPTFSGESAVNADEYSPPANSLRSRPPAP